MAFNKNKALENALKYLNQGKVAQAIGEYQQILRHDAKDQATLMTVGDLFARQGDMPQAIEYFERLAQVYLNDGFNSKAIAIYKKIAKLAPNELKPLERLADLYVQQGVLSEARPLFLQIAEAHLKANQAPKAVEVLHRLLDVEPENARVQMRLAELYNVMGQKKEAAQTYFAYAQRLFEHGDTDEAPKLIERALEVDPTNAAAQLLKAKILTAAHRDDEAIATLEKHPEADAGGDVTTSLLELELKAGHADKAADRARNQLVRGNSHFGLLLKVADTLIESGKAKEAIPLLRELREPMTEANEQDKFLQTLLKATEKLPGDTESREFLADFSRHTSDPFHLESALNELVDAYAEAGDFATAEERMKELIEKNRGDERLLIRLDELRQRAAGGSPASAPAKREPIQASKPIVEKSTAETDGEEEERRKPGSAPARPVIAEEPLDEETQRYVSQALTDVDLFSSYGLTHKATHLLENVLQRAPRHTPTLERLLDFYLGAGDERRTAELAAQLEQIHRERQDTVNADRFAELRGRFEKAADASGEKAVPPADAVDQDSAATEVAPAPMSSAAEPEIEVAPTETISLNEEPSPAAHATPGAPAEFEISLMAVDTDEPAAEMQAPVAPPPAVAEPLDPVMPAEPVEAAPARARTAGEEVDLSDEWEAMAQEVMEPPTAAAEQTAPEPVAAPEETTPIEANETTDERIEIELPAEIETPIDTELAEIPMLEIQEATPEAAPEEPAIEISEEATPTAEETAPAEPVTYGGSEFELELSSDSAETAGTHGAATTEDFLSELAAEVEDMETPQASAAKIPAAPANGGPPQPKPAPPPAIAASAEHAVIRDTAPPAGADSVPTATVESLNELAEVFQEFRSELGELTDEDEDLETHYNLGIAYREMGLLDEAIGEFQKVAKAVQKGKPFPYAMNCATLLALSFIDKGEPKIASLWYQRALETPRLDQETVLALRYDLGVALDLAGESSAALDSFRQVYAMNIDYRDVADRIATLQKA
ncbi:MAG TPA: tetratricopeptide repeat protein [Candidatus Acidoferrales bacterium]|jgi:tetratricopeptide (TPR) repeat protein|nr:tetratricopeptide repeat protein [Candidatus Acidoferrales bacterium]